MRQLRPLALVAVILLAAASRLLPHPPNFTPIGAIALFGGAHLREQWRAFVVPLAAMALSDLIIGWHRLVPLVYGSFALTVVIGMWLRDRKTVAHHGRGVGQLSAVLHCHQLRGLGGRFDVP